SRPPSTQRRPPPAGPRPSRPEPPNRARPPKRSDQEQTADMPATAAPASEDRVLVINSGSSSLKFQLLDPQDGTVEAAGLIERVGQGKGNARIVAGEKRSTFEGPVPDHVAAMRIVERLFDDVGMSL